MSSYYYNKISSRNTDKKDKKNNEVSRLLMNQYYILWSSERKMKT